MDTLYSESTHANLEETLVHLALNTFTYSVTSQNQEGLTVCAESSFASAASALEYKVTYHDKEGQSAD